MPHLTMHLLISGYKENCGEESQKRKKAPKYHNLCVGDSQAFDFTTSDSISSSQFLKPCLLGWLCEKQWPLQTKEWFINSFSEDKRSTCKKETWLCCTSPATWQRSAHLSLRVYISLIRKGSPEQLVLQFLWLPFLRSTNNIVPWYSVQWKRRLCLQVPTKME